jgi:hypothetical protein
VLDDAAQRGDPPADRTAAVRVVGENDTRLPDSACRGRERTALGIAEDRNGLALDGIDEP